MSIIDLTNTTWIFNETINLQNNKSYDISFKSGNADYSLLSLSPEAILFNSKYAYDEDMEYITIDSNVTLNSDTTNNYRIVEGGTLSTQGYSVGSVALDGGVLKDATVNDFAWLGNCTIDNCTFNGQTFITGIINNSGSVFNDKVSIADVTTSIDNASFNESVIMVNCDAYFNNCYFDISSDTLAKYIYISGNSTVVLDDTSIDNHLAQSNSSNIIIKNSSYVQVTGINSLITNLGLIDFSANPSQMDSPGIEFSGGAYQQNPVLYDFFKLADGYTINEITISGTTIYKVVEIT